MLSRELLILRPPLYSMSPSFLNLFMKKFTRARRADHFRERLLRDLRQRARGMGLAVARQQQQRAGEPLFAGVEELIDEVRFDAHVPRQHVGDEAIRERGLVVEQPDHRVLLDDQHAARHDRRRRPDADRLTRQGPLAEKVAGGQHRDDRFFADTREHRELDRALLDVPDVVAGLALREDDVAASILHNRSCRAGRFEIPLHIEPARLRTPDRACSFHA